MILLTPNPCIYRRSGIAPCPEDCFCLLAYHGGTPASMQKQAMRGEGQGTR